MSSYTIEKIVSTNIIKLPTTMKIHLVVNVS